ncbi:MAG: DUF5719 family protein [Acidimicrobiia bacterium]|nr:DUF5719 family protein [Acidimicrobiia bacterium]
MSDDTSRRTHRAPAIVALFVLLGGAIVLQQSASSSADSPRPTRGSIAGPSVPDRAAVSSAWYCAEGTSTSDGRASETVIIGNLARHPIDIELTVMAGDQAQKTRRFTVETLAQRRLEIADVVEAADPGVVVEVFGGQAVVEHEVRGNDDIAVGPCTRQASRRWYFADGSTDRGAESWLALFNPFGDDAIVDVRFVTDAGVQEPEGAQALVVPRRSRVSVAVHDLVRRQPDVAISVVARTGRVVAEQSQLFDGTDTRKGIAVSLGVTSGAREWRLPSGNAESGATQSVSIANFSSRPTQVEVRVVGAGGGAGQPERVDLSADGVTRVDLGSSVSIGTEYALEVRAVSHVPIVVEGFGAWAAPSPVTGVASTPGSATTARRWAFAVGRLDDEGDALISAWNVGIRPITVQLYAYTAGDPDSPTSAPAAAVPPGERVTFSLGEHSIRPDQVLVVGADGPIVVGRQMIGGGVSLAPGIPFGR